MQVLQFKTVHLAVIGAIASAFGMAAENINAEPLLTYESNKVVDGALPNANAGTQGFLSPNKAAETYTGKNPTTDTLSFVNKDKGTNSLVYLAGEGSSLTVSKLSELNFSTEERLFGQAGSKATPGTAANSTSAGSKHLRFIRTAVKPLTCSPLQV